MLAHRPQRIPRRAIEHRRGARLGIEDQDIRLLRDERFGTVARVGIVDVACGISAARKFDESGDIRRVADGKDGSDAEHDEARRAVRVRPCERCGLRAERAHEHIGLRASAAERPEPLEIGEDVLERVIAQEFGLDTRLGNVRNQILLRGNADHQIRVKFHDPFRVHR